MDARMRESFLRELMILQSPPILSADPTTGTTGSSHNQQHTASSAPLVEQTKQHQPPTTAATFSGEEPTPPLPSTSSPLTSSQPPQTPPLNEIEQIDEITKLLEKHNNKEATTTTVPSQHDCFRPIDITLLNESGSTGRTLSGSLVACDTNLTHILLNDLKTPIGIQSSALMRLNDVIAIYELWLYTEFED